jgi:hypothetical protein
MTEQQQEELRKFHDDMTHFPEEAKAILRKGPYTANWDDRRENWIITDVWTGAFIDSVKAI